MSFEWKYSESCEHISQLNILPFFGWSVRTQTTADNFHSTIRLKEFGPFFILVGLNCFIFYHFLRIEVIERPGTDCFGRSFIEIESRSKYEN